MNEARIYISGPMTGHPDFNYPAFYEAEKQLFEAGFEPVNPARHFDGRTDMAREQYMRADIEALLTCEGVWMLTGWRGSKGATLEYNIARELGLVVEDYPFLLEFERLRQPTSRVAAGDEARSPLSPQTQYEAWEEPWHPCLKCGKYLPYRPCGVVSPCPACRTKYPHGDCSDG